MNLSDKHFKPAAMGQPLPHLRKKMLRNEKINVIFIE